MSGIHVTWPLHAAQTTLAPGAKLVVRINEVTPDGKSWSVSYGILNLTHRGGHEDPQPLKPGHPYEVEVGCYFTAHRFKKGNRIRVALSESLWPLVWPSPEPVTLAVTTGASRISLPVRPVESNAYTLPITALTDRRITPGPPGANVRITFVR